MRWELPKYRIFRVEWFLDTSLGGSNFFGPFFGQKGYLEIFGIGGIFW